jgi:hypothetical protein
VQITCRAPACGSRGSMAQQREKHVQQPSMLLLLLRFRRKNIQQKRCMLCRRTAAANSYCYMQLLPIYGSCSNTRQYLHNRCLLGIDICIGLKA